MWDRSRRGISGSSMNDAMTLQIHSYTSQKIKLDTIYEQSFPSLLTTRKIALKYPHNFLNDVIMQVTLLVFLLLDCGKTISSFLVITIIGNLIDVELWKRYSQPSKDRSKFSHSLDLDTIVFISEMISIKLNKQSQLFDCAIANLNIE
jgi:hypothetical protein